MSAGIIGIASFYIINKEFYLKKLPDPIYCGFCRNVERSNYTFYRLGHRRWNFAGMFLSKICLLGWKTWYYSF
jgi:hypothetical protein